jgi:argininosuccinate lyase
VPFRDAHEIVGSIVRQLLSEKRDFDALSVAEWRQFSPHFGDDVREAITPEASVRARKTPQSTAPGAVQEALAQTRRWLLHYRDLSS